MLFNHTPTGLSHTFDDERLIADTGLIPLVKLAQDTGLPRAVADRVHIPTDKGANPGGKVMSLVAGMLAGADSIDDMNRNRTGGMKLFISVGLDVESESSTMPQGWSDQMNNNSTTGSHVVTRFIDRSGEVSPVPHLPPRRHAVLPASLRVRCVAPLIARIVRCRAANVGVRCPTSGGSGRARSGE